MSIPNTQLGPLFLGIDVGGTDIKLGLVGADGSLIDSHRTPTETLVSPERVFQYAIDHATSRLNEMGIAKSQLKSVGLAVPGVLDTSDWILREVVNLPGWLGVPLKERLQSAASLPSAVVNDANAAAFAEHSLRNLDHQSLALVTLGTGIGSGVVFGGQPHGGDHGCAGELGHIAVDFSNDALKCTCGSRGHLESYAGAAGVVARLQRKLASVGNAPRPECLQGERITPRDIAIAAEADHSLSCDIIDETAIYIGRAIGMIGQVADPAVVLLGGAMTFGGSGSPVGQRFIQAIRASVTATTLVQVGGNMMIDFATLGNTAGMIGAAMVAKRAIA